MGDKVGDAFGSGKAPEINTDDDMTSEYVKNFIYSLDKPPP